MTSDSPNPRALSGPVWIMDTAASWAAKAHYLATMAVFERAIYLGDYGTTDQAKAELEKVPEPDAPGIMPLMKELEAVGAVRVSTENGKPVYEFVMLDEALETNGTAQA